MDEKQELERLAAEVEKLADPVEREAVTLGIERGSGELRIPFTTSRIIRDEYGRIDGLIGGGITKKILRDENGRAVEVYEEREEIVPE